MDEEISKGHMMGPFDEPPLPDMVFLPINLVLKPDGSHRLIHDLAHPYNGVNSVNVCIPQSNSYVQYHYIDKVIDMALHIGSSAIVTRVDFLHAFRNLSVHLVDLGVLGFTLDGKYYINTSVPFGAASSCLIFEKVASLIEWIVANETSRETPSHYLDDFLLLARSMIEAQKFLQEYHLIAITHVLQGLSIDRIHIGCLYWITHYSGDTFGPLQSGTSLK